MLNETQIKTLMGIVGGEDFADSVHEIAYS